jgi:hypothetical protein
MIIFARDCGALELSLAIDQGADTSPAVMLLDPIEETLEIREGDQVRLIPDIAVFDDAQPLGEVHVHKMPPFEVDLNSDEIVGALGGIEHLALSLVNFAHLFPGESVVAAQFPTVGEDSLDLIARTSGEVGIHCGGVDFETPAGWPAS